MSVRNILYIRPDAIPENKVFNRHLVLCRYHIKRTNHANTDKRCGVADQHL